MFVFMLLSLFSSYSRRDGCVTGFKRMGETTVIGMVMVIGFKKVGKARLVPSATCWESWGTCMRQLTVLTDIYAEYIQNIIFV
jgi:hypothetical protein